MEKKPDYCTRPEVERCWDCPLIYYGRDCKKKLIDHAEENARFFSALDGIADATAAFHSLGVQDWDISSIFDFMDDDQDDRIFEVMGGMEKIIELLKNIMRCAGYGFPPFIKDHFEELIKSLKCHAGEFDHYVNGDFDRNAAPGDRLTGEKIVEYTEIAEKLTVIINTVEKVSRDWAALGLDADLRESEKRTLHDRGGN